MEVQRATNGVDTSTTATNTRYHHYNHHYDLHHQQQPAFQQNGYYGYTSPTFTPTTNMRKRKAETQDNERLSKRLSLLNLEKNGHKLYVPVESPSAQPFPEHGHPGYNNPVQPSSSPIVPDDGMQLDNTKHKVYIYDLDAELSSADEQSEGESLPGSPTSGGRLIFVPDIGKHLYKSRIPPSVLANSEGQLAGHDINDMQMVLYSEPSSLTVPREHDSVRKAILEARARARQRQKDSLAETDQAFQPPGTSVPADALGFGQGRADMNSIGGHGAANLTQGAIAERDGLVVDNDPDAMDMD
ncbi:hypothetical protein F4802DRAFT_16074 [Xylaria palmicola]|nr:hypothetical protein F4802DRAFT_16074 [Xylaria palmicola]